MCPFLTTPLPSCLLEYCLKRRDQNDLSAASSIFTLHHSVKPSVYIGGLPSDFELRSRGRRPSTKCVRALACTSAVLITSDAF